MSELNPISESFQEEYQHNEALFKIQPAIIQRFLEAQARQLADAFIQRTASARFSLPDRVVCDVSGGESSAAMVPQSVRNQSVGNLRDRLVHNDVHATLRERLSQLEQSPERAISVGAALVRHAIALHMVYNILPSGRSVKYIPEEGDEIPSIPVASATETESAITADTDAIAEEGKADDGRGSLLVPFVAVARRFYLPQWVAFGDDNNLIVNSVQEAEAHVASMQRFLMVIFAARSLAPYMVVDEEFQRKRYGMLGQLVNQGRALAIYQAREIIARIKERAASGNLNRGLSLSLPYFDDQYLRIDITKLEVIPAGRIMFVPAFVVRAVRQEEVKVSQDTRFNPSTRKHILYLLELLEKAFETA